MPVIHIGVDLIIYAEIADHSIRPCASTYSAAAGSWYLSSLSRREKRGKYLILETGKGICAFVCDGVNGPDTRFKLTQFTLSVTNSRALQG
jgi:hypothetical protein